MMAKKMTKKQIKRMAEEVRSFLLDHDLWVDVTIYFNGIAFSTDDRNGHFFYNDPEKLIVLRDQDPKRITEYAGDILTMTFEGDLFELMNYPWDFGTGNYGFKLKEELESIFQKYGTYSEQGQAWNLTLAYM